MDDEASWLGHPGDDSAFGVIVRFDVEARIVTMNARAPAGLLLNLLSEEGTDSILALLRAEAAFDVLVAGWGESAIESGDTGPTGTPDDPTS